MKKTPTAVLDAMLPASPPQVGPITLRRFTLAQFMFLEKLGSPLLQGTEKPPEMLDSVRALVVMSRPIEETLRLSQEDKLDAEAWELADKIDVAELPQIAATLAAHISQGFASAVPMRPPRGAPGSEGSAPFAESQPSPAGSVGA